MIPTTPPPNIAPDGKQPRNIGRIRKIGAGLAAVVLVAGFVLTLQLVHAAHSTSTSRLALRAASGPSTPTADQTAAASATTDSTATTRATAGATASATAAPGATATTNIQRNDVRVTQNQDMRVPCTTSSQPHYTVQLFNSGNMAVNWQTKFAMLQNSDNPYWGYSSPDHGSIGSDQSVSIAISVIYQVPCGGSTYDASIVLTYPAGAWQPDLALTFAGTGPTPIPTYSQVVLVSGSQNVSESCPPSGIAPAPFTFAIENTGTTWTVPTPYFSQSEEIGLNYWAGMSVTASNAPPNAISNRLYPGETWTVTISPSVYVACGRDYHVYVGINDVQGQWTMTFTDTFH